jgi:hypothetical protein
MKRLLLAVLACACALASEARASCGAAFCMVNTSWNTQGVWTEPGVRVDLRFEYIDQDQPMAGDSKVGVGEISQHHDEVRTINRNWLATVDYAFNADWGISATLPLIDRDHTHIHNHRGAQLVESWSFREVGDARVLGRRQWRSESPAAERLDSYGVNLGLKLPTGKRDLSNGDGAIAERSLQPGSGTTDLLVGGFFSRTLGSGSSWFADALVQSPLDMRDDYEPGARASVDLGYRREFGAALAGMLQLNLLFKDRDKGSQAEPANTGGTFLYASPGVGYLVGKSVQVYGFVQLPLYQYVNGVQLVADWALAAGVSTRF